MRDLILKRIGEIKSRENGFSKSIMKWKSLNYDLIHISEVDFGQCSDSDLTLLFELIVKRYYTS